MRRIQIRARAIGIAAIVASIGCAASAPAPASPPHEQTVPEAIYEELQPVALKNCTLKRFGSRNDGGYLMCENLVDGVRSAYSYGIDTEDNWGCDVSREYKVPVHQYDCFTEHRPTCDGGTFHEPNREERRRRQTAPDQDGRRRRRVGFADGDAR